MLILQACENRIPETTTTESPVNEVTFTSTLDDASASRAYDSQWEAGDKIGVYMAASGTNEPQGENIPYITEQNDGFFIANEDLKLRGPGDLFGVRQSGLLEFKIGDVFTDAKILKEASEEAARLLKEDPDLALPEHQALKKRLLAYREEGIRRMSL